MAGLVPIQSVFVYSYDHDVIYYYSLEDNRMAKEVGEYVRLTVPEVLQILRGHKDELPYRR